MAGLRGDFLHFLEEEVAMFFSTGGIFVGCAFFNLV